MTIQVIRKFVILLFGSAALFINVGVFAANDLENFTSDMRDELRWSNAPVWGGVQPNYYTTNATARSSLYSLCDTCSPGIPPTPETLQCISCATSSCGSCSGGGGCSSWGGGCRSD